MHGLLRTTLCITLLHFTHQASASEVYRCEDSGGHITFTQQGCSASQQQNVQSATNQAPSGGKPASRPKAQKTKSLRSKKSKAFNTDVVVISQQQDGCGNQVTGSGRRKAMIDGQVRSGMLLKDVERALGKPDKISSQNGVMRYLYRDKNGNTKQVSFDENGCVRSKR
ncbi:MAG: hypothetical protein ACI9EB_000231 [Pseudomonas sp.]|jgi:hypothetical protein